MTAPAPALTAVSAPAAALCRVLTLPGVPESVREFRALAREMAATPYQAEAAALCVSELVTNAIVHTWSGVPDGLVLVMIEAAPLAGELRISVIDDGTRESWAALCVTEPGEPAVTEPAVTEPGQSNGYGLGIVDAVATEWGTVPAGGRSLTWCDIPEVAA